MINIDEYSDFVLVTGSTGFIGAHVVDTLLARGLKVRGATRLLAKGDEMIRARPQYSHKLEFVQIQDFENPGGLTEAVEGVDAVIHVASVRPPLSIDEQGKIQADSVLISHSTTTSQTTKKSSSSQQ